MPSLVEISTMVLKKNILNFVYVFSLICYNLPLEKDGAFRLHKLESHSSKDACAKFCINWLSGIGIIYFNFVNEFPLFRYYLPVEKDGDLHLNKLESPSPRYAFICTKFG